MYVVLKDILGYYNKRKVGRYTQSTARGDGVHVDTSRTYMYLHVLKDILGYYNKRKVGRYTQSTARSDSSRYVYLLARSSSLACYC